MINPLSPGRLVYCAEGRQPTPAPAGACDRCCGHACRMPRPLIDRSSRRSHPEISSQQPPGAAQCCVNHENGNSAAPLRPSAAHCTLSDVFIEFGIIRNDRCWVVATRGRTLRAAFRKTKVEVGRVNCVRAVWGVGRVTFLMQVRNGMSAACQNL